VRIESSLYEFSINLSLFVNLYFWEHKLSINKTCATLTLKVGNLVQSAEDLDRQFYFPYNDNGIARSSVIRTTRIQFFLFSFSQRGLMCLCDVGSNRYFNV